MGNDLNHIVKKVKSSKTNSYYRGDSGSNITQETYFQFVLGHVTEAMLYSPWPDTTLFDSEGEKDFLYNSHRITNAIRAVKYDGNAVQSVNIEALDADIYYPLTRGITDTPTQGDQVLLCKFGGINYYIGPINTQNSPNYNVDHLFQHDSLNKISLGKSLEELDVRDTYNMNPDFSFQPGIRRLSKPVNLADVKFGSRRENPKFATNGVGDLVLEGRYGNSIRLGNRGGLPVTILSNGRNIDNRWESLHDGSIFFSSCIGTLNDHFSFERVFDISSDKALKEDKSVKVKRLLNFDTEYSGQQILISSGRLIFNSKEDKYGGNLILSSHSNIEMGAADKIKIYSNNETIIESKNIYLGEKAEGGEPLVLGNELVKLLTDMVGHIGKLYVAATVAGISSPIETGGSPGWMQLQQLVSQMEDKILSKHHYIEKNGKK